jgi:EmrB/QacA subfamily drug resistance transporter
VALAALCLSVVIVNVDNTILNVALPVLARTLDATSSGLQWIVDSYALVFAGLLLVGGSLADRFGRKRFFLLGMSVFTAASLWAAFSTSVGMLISARAAMGVGAALTMPSTLSLINDIFRDPVQRARAISAWAGVAGLGIAIGPIAGGLLLAHYWWGSVFLVNVPIAAVAVLGAVLFVPDSKNPAAKRPDPVGAALSIAGLGLLLWAIIEAPADGWTSATVIGAGAAGLATLGGFVLWEHRSDHPMLDLAIFRDPHCSAAAAGELLGLFGLFGGLFVQTQFLQFDLGYSPLQAGLRILPVAAVLVVASALSPALGRRIGAKAAATFGLAAIAAGLWQVSSVSTPSATYGDILPGIVIIGAGAGLLLSTATDSLVGSLPRGDAAVGSATNGVSVQVGGALGVAVIGSVLATRYQNRMGAVLGPRHVPASVAHVIEGSLGGALGVAQSVGGATGQALAGAAKAAFMSGMALSLATGAAVALAGAAVVLAWLPARPARRQKGDGDE